MSGYPNKRKVSDAAIVIALLALVAAAPFIYIAIKHSQAGRTHARKTDLRALAIAITQYADYHGGTLIAHTDYPRALVEWHDGDLLDPMFTGQSRDQSHPYIYVGPPARTFNDLPEGADPSAIPMFYEHPGHLPGRTSVAFWNGSVRSIKDRDFVKTFAGITNPDGSPYVPVGLDAIKTD